jgi:EmrB/QacA subfamily drug resistance transporter
MADDKSYKWFVLFITSVGAMMAPLDGSIVGVALPSITSSLRMSYVSVIWVPAAYLVTLAVSLLVLGRLSDTRGRKPILISGFAIFVLSSFLCSVAQNGVELILFRILQGFGCACMAATATAIVADVFPGKERGKALGINIMSVYVGGAVGPSLGGALTYAFGWRSVFWVNIPIGLTIMTLAIWRLKESVPKREKEPFDIPGMLTFSIGLISLLVAMTVGESAGWTSLPIIGLLALALASFGLFILSEMRKGSKAMIDLSLIAHNRLFAAANIAALLNYTAFFSASFIMSFYLQRVLGRSPLETGAILISMPITMALLAPISGWASDRVGSRMLSTGGMVCITIGLLLLSTLTLTSSTSVVTIYLLILGAGMGLFSSPNTNAIMGCVEKRQLGVASGMVATMRTTGQSLSLAVSGAIIAVVASSKVVTSLFSGTNPARIAVESAAFVHGMSLAFIVSAVIAAVGAVFSFARGSLRQAPKVSNNER